MVKPIITSFETLAPLIIQQYERYLPTAFDDSLTMLEKVNKIIEYLNQIGLVSNTLITQWNDVIEWVMGEGLTEGINKKLDEMLTSGELENLISHREVNVLYLGAKGDYNPLTGIGTDNLTAFNNAVNALPAEGGKIFIPDGDYLISDSWEIQKNNVTIELSSNAIVRSITPTTYGELIGFRGVGSGLVPTLKNGRVIGGGTLIAPAPLDNAIGFVRVDGCFVNGVTVSCGHKGVTTQEYNKNITIKNVRVLKADTAGIALETGVENAIVKDILIDDCGKGVMITGGAERAKNVLIESVIVSKSTSDGIQVSQADDINIKGNILKNIGLRGITVDNSKGFNISGNVLRSVKRQGINIAIASESFNIEGNVLNTVGTESNNTFNAIEIYQSSVPCNVANNTLLGSNHKWSVNIGESPTIQAVFKGNNFSKGLSDEDYTYQGWKPVTVNDVFGGKHFILDNGGQKTLYGTTPPLTGFYATGDKVFNTAPTITKNIVMWVCRVAGNPATWCAVGTGHGTTAQRPTGMGTTEIGYCYYDTDLRKVISWDGFNWVV